jgi:VanZ family protein
MACTGGGINMGSQACRNRPVPGTRSGAIGQGFSVSKHKEWTVRYGIQYLRLMKADFMDRTTQLAKLLFWAALFFALFMALSPRPPAVPGNIGDKYQHMLAFATLTILACAGYRETPLLYLGERLSFFGALIEVTQSIPSLGRDCDVRDWVADTLVLFAVLIVVAAWRRSWRKRLASSA